MKHKNPSISTRKGLNLLNSVVFVFFSISILLFFYSYVELSELGRACYYSDSEYYYQMQLSKGPWIECDGALYVGILRCFGDSKISYDVGKIVIFLVYLGLVVLGYQSLANSKLQYVLCMLHPFCIFSFIRGMKESAIVIIYLLAGLMFKYISRPIVRLFTLSTLAFLMSLIRPLGEFHVAAAVLASVFLQRYKMHKAILLYIMIVLGVWSDIPVIGEVLEEHQSSYSEAKVEYNILLQPLIFIFGPTPIKPILHMFGGNLYEFSTPLTLFVLFFGSLVSLYLARSVYQSVVVVKSEIGGLIFIYSALLLMASYVILYGGQAEVRYRGMFFSLIGVSFLFKVEKKCECELGPSNMATA